MPRLPLLTTITSLVVIGSACSGSADGAATTSPPSEESQQASEGPFCEPESPQALASFPVVGQFPGTEAGTTARTWFELIEGGDEAARLQFVQDHVSDQVAPDWTDDQKVADIAGIQADLEGAAIATIAEENPLTFHVTLEQPNGRTVVATIEIGAADHGRIVCNAFTEWS